MSLIRERVGQNQKRPLLNVSDRKGAIRRLLNAREKHYRSLADTVVYNNGGPPEKKVSRLIRDCGWTRTECPHDG